MRRDEVLAILDQHVKTDRLRKHLLAVEAAMRAYARQHGQDQELWGNAGLLHDFDWDICPTPEQHPMFGAELLRQRNVPEPLVRAVLSHGDHASGVGRESLLEKVLYAVDELSGFVTAVTLVHPHKSLGEVTPQAVRKKMKDKAFARTVRREDILQGAQALGLDLDAHIQFVIDALKPVASQLGLYP